MACLGCSCGTTKPDSKAEGTPKGCASGGCATGGCNKRNTYDWITAMGITDAVPFDMVEVSFKNGARKDFYKNPPWARVTTGDWVVVDTGGGFDIGRVALSGELVKLQMKKKHVREDYRFNAVVRKSNERDMERYSEIRELDQPTMVKARAIGRSLRMDMKVSDVEFQADGRKATFYYTAQGRIDFRELIRLFAKEFRVKIEMRQIGARQETARLGGIGPCGRELCCSTWLTDFKSVSTAAARYQNIAINQTKLSGQCGRLKCCLNYELDTYIEALDDFPERADRIQMQNGKAILIKTDVFKRIMYYAVEGERGKLYILSVDTVKEIIEKSKKGEKLDSLNDMQVRVETAGMDDEPDFEAVNDVIDLPPEERRKKKKKKKPSDGAPRPAERSGSNPDRPRPEMRPRPPQADGENRPEQPRNPNQNPQNRPPRPPKAEGATRPQQPRTQHPNPQNRPPRPPQNDGEPRPPRPDGPPNADKTPGENNSRNNRNRNRGRGPKDGGGGNGGGDKPE